MKVIGAAHSILGLPLETYAWQARNSMVLKATLSDLHRRTEENFQSGKEAGKIKMDVK